MAVGQTPPTDPEKLGSLAPQGPVRTCIGCRQRTVATELLRIVVITGTDGGAETGAVLVPDPRRRMPGRGAWLHPVPACVELAQRRRAFARALRVSGPIDPAPIAEYVAVASTAVKTAPQ